MYVFRKGASWHNDWLGKFNADRNKAYKEMFVATPFVQYIECVFSFRKAKRTEVEKEYCKKATSVPQDLLRCVT